MLLAVQDRTAAAATFADILGAVKVREDALEQPYNAKRTVVQAGESEFEFLEPAGEGIVAQHFEQWGEGIFAAGFSTSDAGGVARSMQDEGLHFTYQGSEIFVEPDQTRGMRTVIRESEKREAVGHISHLYEVTNIVDDFEEAAGFYASIFGLDKSRFSPITSKHFGYTGSLTLFDPPARLDRIELTQITDPEGAMGRFYGRRGASVYMCFAESPNVAAIREALEAREARIQPTGEFPDSGLFIHPRALHGMLMGISYTNVAWKWSGRPELAPTNAAV